MKTETLSAALDGECSPEELDRLLDELARDPALKRDFSRLCLSAEVQAGTAFRKDQPCIAAGVMARLGAQDDFSPKVAVLDTRRPTLPARKMPQWLGYAAAASLAAVAVLVAMPAREAANTTSGSSGFSPQVSTQPVSVPLPRRARDLRTVSITPDEQEQLDELNDMLMEHSNTAAQQGMGGTLRYARYAAHSETGEGQR